MRRLAGGLCLVLLGCTTTQSESGDVEPDPRHGAEGKLSFGADHCFLPRCQVPPLMAGMVSRINLSAIDRSNLDGGMRAELADPAVATGAVVPSTIVNGVPTYDLEITAAQPGTTELRVLDAAGALIDRTRIEVRVATSFKFSQILPADRPNCTGCVEHVVVDQVAVDVGKASKAIYVQPFDAGGDRLEAAKEFTFSVEDTKIAKLDCLVGICITFGSDNQSVRGVAAGTTRFLVEAAGVKGSLPVVVR